MEIFFLIVSGSDLSSFSPILVANLMYRNIQLVSQSVGDAIIEFKIHKQSVSRSK